MFIRKKAETVNLLGGDTVDEDGQNTPPGVQIVTGDTAGAQDIEKETAEVLFQGIHCKYRSYFN